MKKNDFKKLALLGIAGGTLVVTPVSAELADANSYGNLLAFAGCASHGCGGSSMNTNTSNAGTNQTQQASRTAPAAQNAQPGYSANYQPQQGCGSQQAPRGQAYYSGGCNARGPSQGQSYNGCGARTAQPTYASGCGARAPSQGQSYNGCGARTAQPSYAQGCGARSPMQGQQMQAQMYTDNMPHQAQGCGAKRAPQEQAYNSRPMNSSWNSMADNQPITQWEPPSQNQNQMKRQNLTNSQNNRMNSSYMSDADQDDADNTTQLTESQLLSQLNDEGKATYKSLDPAGKALALKLANQTCKGQNECKGLNSCKTEKNSCAGNGGCAGTSPGAFKDKNTAVKVAAKKMAEKRNHTNGK